MTLVSQLNGRAASPVVDKLNKVQEKKLKKDSAMLLNIFLNVLGERYMYDYKVHEIDPRTREVINVCKDCNETIPESDVEVFE